MKYNVHIANTAKSDIVKAADYIEFALKNPAAAGRLLDKVDAVIKKLGTFPCRNPIVDDTILAARGIRFIPVNNYLLFYFVSEEEAAVHIVRFLYAKSNWMHILKL